MFASTCTPGSANISTVGAAAGCRSRTCSGTPPIWRRDSRRRSAARASAPPADVPPCAGRAAAGSPTSPAAGRPQSGRRAKCGWSLPAPCAPPAAPIAARRELRLLIERRNLAAIQVGRPQRVRRAHRRHRHPAIQLPLPARLPGDQLRYAAVTHRGIALQPPLDLVDLRLLVRVDHLHQHAALRPPQRQRCTSHCSI